MSAAIEGRLSAKAQSRKCAARLWRLVPHVLLSLSLVAYAALGALLFQHIEGGSASTTQQEYRVFLGQIVDTVQNSTGEQFPQKPSCQSDGFPSTPFLISSNFIDVSRQRLLRPGGLGEGSGDTNAGWFQVHLAPETRQVDFLWIHVLLLHRVHHRG